MDNMPRKSIEEASAAELRDFAKLVGLEVKGDENKNVILSKLKTAGMELKDIPIVQQPTAPAPQGPISSRPMVNENGEPELDAEGKPRFERQIIVFGGDTPAEKRPVPVTVNGSTMLIPRDGKAHWVPNEYIEALENAVLTSYDVALDERGNEVGVGDPIYSQSYPYSFAG